MRGHDWDPRNLNTFTIHVVRVERPKEVATVLPARTLLYGLASANSEIPRSNSLPHEINTALVLPASIMAGKTVGAPEDSLSSFKLEGSFLSFSFVNALDKLMQGNPDSFARQSSTSGPPMPTVHLLSPIILTKLIAACACCGNNNGTLPSMTCVSLMPSNFWLLLTNARAKGMR